MTAPTRALNAPGKHYRENVSPVNSKPCSGADYFCSPAFVRHYPDAWRWYPAEVVQPPMAPGEIRASLLHGEEYLSDALDAHLEGDDARLVNAIEVLSAIVAVVAGQLRGSPSEQLSVH
jgi:hypothetical protein